MTVRSQAHAALVDVLARNGDWRDCPVLGRCATVEDAADEWHRQITASSTLAGDLSRLEAQIDDLNIEIEAARR